MDTVKSETTLHLLTRKRADHMKTVKELLQSIPDRKVRKRALRNLDLRFADYPASTIQQALSIAFIYKDTPEGLDYWSDIHFKYGSES